MSSQVNKSEGKRKKRRLEAPDTYVILLLVLLFAVVATYIIPAGSFDREVIDGVEQVVPNTYHKVDSNPAGIMDIFLALQSGMVESASIIFLVLFAGGMFEIIERSGAIRAGILKAVDITRGKEFLLLATITVLFSLGGAIGAVANTVIPFVAIGIMIARALRLDAIVAVAITFCAAFAGFNVGFLNPYTLGIAQTIADVPLFSGMAFRVTFYVIIVATTVWYIWRYAKKIMNDPSKSVVGILEFDESEQIEEVEFTTRQKLILAFTALALGFFVFATIKFQWGIDHMSALFIIIAIVCGIIARMNYNEITKVFLEGCTKLVYGALIIGVARAIVIVMENANILDTLVYALSVPLDNFTPVVAAFGMFLANAVINFFVPSGSGQAMIVMPILTPLADMIGVTRQVAVQTFQLGDGFANVLFPTSGILMACLAIAGVSWTKWARWILPLFTIWVILGIAMLTIGVLINWGPI